MRVAKPARVSISIAVVVFLAAAGLVLTLDAQ
jgi:hypothetical protein